MIKEIADYVHCSYYEYKTMWHSMYDTVLEQVNKYIQMKEQCPALDEAHICYTIAQNIYYVLTKDKPIGHKLYHLWEDIHWDNTTPPLRRFLEIYLNPIKRKRGTTLSGMLAHLKYDYGVAIIKDNITLTDQEIEENRRAAQRLRDGIPDWEIRPEDKPKEEPPKEETENKPAEQEEKQGEEKGQEEENNQNDQDMDYEDYNDCRKCDVQFVINKNGKGFADIAGMEELKEQMKAEVMWPLTHKEIALKYRVHVPNGMLLYGPPGCGKTYFGQKLAEECKLPFAYVRGSDLGSTYIHGSQTMIADLFRKAIKHAPCILFLDEIDTIIAKRGSSDGYDLHYNNETTEFLVQMNNCSEKGVFIIGATNFPENIDAAALRSGRMDKFVMIPMPDEETRAKLFEIELQDRPVSRDIDYLAVASLVDGATCSDISLICNNAALAAALEEKEITEETILKTILKMTHRTEDKAENKETAQCASDTPTTDNNITPIHPKIGFLSAQYQKAV